MDQQRNGWMMIRDKGISAKGRLTMRKLFTQLRAMGTSGAMIVAAGVGVGGMASSNASGQCPALVDGLFTVLPSDRPIRDIAAYTDGTNDFIAAVTWVAASNMANFVIYRREGPAWFREHFSSISGSSNQYVSVAMVGDVAVVGKPFVTDFDVGETGEVEVYTRRFNTVAGQWEWRIQDALLASDAAFGDEFGHSVAIAGNGDIVVGARTDNNAGGTDAGAVYVFNRSGSSSTTWNWTQSQKLVPADPEVQQNFGKSVAVGSTSNRFLILVGASGDDAPGVSNAGAAYVFSRSITPGSTFTEVEKIVSTTPTANDFFGYRVGLVGSSAVIGMAGPLSGSYIGAVFTTAATNFPPTNWAAVTRITAPDGAVGDYFGQNIAVSGNTFLVSAEGDDDAGTNAGAVYVYRSLSGVWTNIDKVTRGSRTLGFPLALSGTLGVLGSRFVSDGSNRVEVLDVRQAEFTAQPTNRTVSGNCAASYSAAVAAPAATSVQWQFKEQTGTTWANIMNGANTATGGGYLFDGAGVATLNLTLSHPGIGTWSIPGSVRCIITTPCGTATSAEATLGLRRVDINCSGAISVQDIFDFLAVYFAGASEGDFNQSGTNSVQDIFDFLAAYFAESGRM